MSTVLFALMLLVWLSLFVYEDDAPAGFLKLACSPLVAAMLFGLTLLVSASSLGRKSIRFVMEDV